MLADRDIIERYIPQRTPLVMVHSLLEATEDFAVSSLYVSEDNIFVSNGELSEPGLIENIAQTAAVHAGYQYGKHNTPVPIGFIAAIKNLEVLKLPKVKSSIRTTVRIINKVMEVTIIEGKIEQDQALLCSCEMRIYIKQ